LFRLAFTLPTRASFSRTRLSLIAGAGIGIDRCWPETCQDGYRISAGSAQYLEYQFTYAGAFDDHVRLVGHGVQVVMVRGTYLPHQVGFLSVLHLVQYVHVQASLHAQQCRQ
jgi:hypothetical protein